MSSRFRRTPLVSVLLASGLCALDAIPFVVAAQPRSTLAAQEVSERIQDSQERLEEVRRERQQLVREARNLAGQVHTVSEEITNLEQQIGTSAAVLVELDVQIGSYGIQVKETSREMLSTRDELTLRRVELNERLREIYKRGPLRVFQVLLQARSFGDLLGRYKYLHLIALYDRTLVGQVKALEELLEAKRKQLATEYARLAGLRLTKKSEITDLEQLEGQRQRRLRNVRAQASRSEDRISELRREEERLNGLIADLERARLEAERLAGAAPATLELTTADIGQLDWPVEGTIAYRFHEIAPELAVAPNGVGILAPRGTPVTVVQDGEVLFADRRGTYGLTVLVSHGGGYWSGYLYLDDLRVRFGDRVRAGQVIGHVGGDGTRPQMEFQIYEPDSKGLPRQVDPIRWLRNRS